MTILFDCIRPKGTPIKGAFVAGGQGAVANPCGEISLPVDSTTSVLTYTEEQAQELLDQMQSIWEKLASEDLFRNGQFGF